MQEQNTQSVSYQHDMEDFAVAVSHDLQEPLRMVICFTELLEKRYGDTLDEDGCEFLAYASDGAKRMRAMLDGLLEYTRITTRGNQFLVSDSKQIFQESLQAFQKEIDERGAEITVPDIMPQVMADQHQLYLLFKHLLDNAIKFCPLEKKPQISLSIEEQDGRWLFIISDNALDIEARYYDEIFRIFSTLHGKNVYPGTGMGLPVCKKIIERHGGTISIKRLESGHKAFCFSLPKV